MKPTYYFILIFSLIPSFTIYSQTSNAGEDQFVCNTFTDLFGNNPAPGTGEWTIVEGYGDFENSTVNNTHVSNLSDGENIFRWTVTLDANSVSDEVSIFNYTVTEAIAEDVSVCEDSATLIGSAPNLNEQCLWETSPSSITISNPDYYTTKVYNFYEGVNSFNYTIFNDYCSSETSITATNNIFFTNAGEDQIVITPNTTLDAQNIPGTIGTWTIVTGGGDFADVLAPDTYVSNLQYGENIFCWTVYNPTTGCTAYDTVTIIYNGGFPNPIDAGATQHICADSTYLDATTLSNATTYWSIDQGACNFVDITDCHTLAYNIEPGQNILRWNVSKNGFTTSDTVSIYNYSFDVDAGEDQHLCDYETVMDGSNPQNTPYGDNWTGTWTIIEGSGMMTNPNNPNTEYFNLASDTNRVIWTVYNNEYQGASQCFANDTVNIIYHEMPASDFETDPSIMTGCSPLTLDFVNTTNPEDTIVGTEYQWIFGNYTTDFVNYDSIPLFMFVNPSDTSEFIVPVSLVQKTEIENLTCYDTTTKNITVYPVPVASFDASPQITTFPNSNITIENTSTINALSYTWNFGNSVTFVDYEYQSNYSNYYDTWGDYMITLEVWNEFNCRDLDTNQISILAPIPASSGNNNTMSCGALANTLYANVLYDTPGESEYKWVILTEYGDTIDVIYNKDFVYNFSEYHVYLADLYVTAEGSTPAWSYTFVRTDTIEIIKNPSADFEINQESLLPYENIEITNLSVNAEEYTWQFGNEESYDEFEPDYSFSESGTYDITLTVLSKEICIDSKTLTVTVNSENYIFFPNAFSPNPSGSNGGYYNNMPISNDVFHPISYGVEEYTMLIYDRKGKLLFETNDINIGWDGYYNGKICTQGEYIFMASGSFADGQIIEEQGEILLLR